MKKKRAMSKSLFVPGVVLVVVLLVGWAMSAYFREIPRTITQVSRIFLEEITARETAHLQNNLESHFQALRAGEQTMRLREDDTLRLLQEDLGKIQGIYDYSFFALIDSDGNYCTARELRPAVTKINSLNTLLEGEERLVSFNETISGRDVILLGQSITPFSVDGHRFVSICAGIEVDNFIQRMALDGLNGHSQINLVQRSGLYITYVASDAQSIQRGSSLFSVLERQTTLDPGYSLNQMRTDMQQGQSGMMSYVMGENRQYLYYAPLPSTEWYVVTRMPYQTLLDTVRRFVAKTAAVCGVVVALLAALVLFVLRVNRRMNKARQEAEQISMTLRQTDQAKQQAEEALRHAAYYDELTGIANANMLRQSAWTLLHANAAGYAYILLDVRKFKVINALFGYAQGDRLLQFIASRLEGLIGKGELACRYSADCFHMLLLYTDQKTLERRLYALADQICTFEFTTGSSYHLAVGFGIYIIENRDEPVVQMGDHASLALKNSKTHHAVSLAFYDDETRNQIFVEQEIENNMQRGVSNREFQVYLQPKYNPVNGRMEGAEALVRWIDPEKGLLSPNLFIPVFEKNSFITTLDLYVLEETCRLIRQWIDEGRHVVPVSVNQSRLLLYNTDYVQQIVGILERHQVARSLIELEITENVFFEDAQRMVSIMTELRGLGFKVSMDDFGSGYSSLNMLSGLEVDTLKIDRDFFSQNADSDRGRRIVGSIVLMAQDLGIQVVAEGVETSEQVEFLCRVGCDLVQGFFYSRPIPNAEFAALLPMKNAATPTLPA